MDVIVGFVCWGIFVESVVIVGEVYGVRYWCVVKFVGDFIFYFVVDVEGVVWGFFISYVGGDGRCYVGDVVVIL